MDAEFVEKLKYIKSISGVMTADEWRFWAKVDIRADDECWEWTSALSGTGRAIYSCAGRTMPAARYLWSLMIGTMPTRNVVIRHTCDNPTCVNPNHLVAGTHADNMTDKSVRGRVLYMSVVDEDIRIAAVAAYRAGQGTQLQVALQYGMCVKTLQKFLKVY